MHEKLDALLDLLSFTDEQIVIERVKHNLGEVLNVRAKQLEIKTKELFDLSHKIEQMEEKFMSEQ